MGSAVASVLKIPCEWDEILSRPITERGYQLNSEEKQKKSPITNSPSSLQQGSVVVAAITLYQY